MLVKISNQYQLGILIFIILLNLSSCKQGQAELDKKPNIILILTDDQGWGDLSLNGNRDINTPNIDKLAQEGIVFNRFYVNAVCSPTRAEILTGRYAVRSGVYSTSEGGERINLDETLLPEILKDNGYKTGAFGKWHSGTQGPYHPNSRGFDEYYGFTSGHWGNYFSPMLDHNGAIVQGSGFLPDDITNKALEFIENHQEEPFFVFLPYNTPHSPMQVPDSLWDRFKNKTLTMKHRFQHKEAIEHTKAAYALCENIDWNVGRIKEKLSHLALTNQTIIIYMSDNGPNGWRYNGELKGIKGSVDEGGTRSPFIINWPENLQQGKTIKQIAGAIDLLPTLIDLTNSKFTASNLDGISLAPLLKKPSTNWNNRFLVSNWNGKTSLRDQTFILDENNELFHLVNDPQQTANVADLYPKVLDSMLTFKTQWEATVLTALPEKDERPTPVGYAKMPITQLPARDAKFTGNIKRSNRWPNDSFLTNWTKENDTIYWEVEVMESGIYEAEMFYTCPNSSVGTKVVLSSNKSSIQQPIKEAHDPPLVGHEKDRAVRIESYVKDFITMPIGTIELEKGPNKISLNHIPNEAFKGIDFRLLTLKRKAN